MEEMMVKVSIIIPVYNVEKYLDRCLKSIMNQTADDYEIILIDDGSTDNSPQICDKYSSYNEIRVIHKKNGGLSDARNVGMKNATGEYLWFIDSDDYIEPGSLKVIQEKLSELQCDVLVIGSKKVNQIGEIKNEVDYSIPVGLYTSEEYMEILNHNPKSVIFCAPYHICRRNFIINQGFVFLKNILHEDELWTPPILLNAESIYYSGLNVYYHYIRDDSIMTSNNYERSGKSYVIIVKKLLKIYDESGKENLRYLRDHLVTTYLQTVWKCPKMKKKQRVNRIILLKNSYYTKTRIKCILYFLSPTVYRFIHKIAKKIEINR